MAKFYAIVQTKPDVNNPGETTNTINGYWNGATMDLIPTGFTPDIPQTLLDNAAVFGAIANARVAHAAVQQLLGGTVQVDIIQIEQTRALLAGFTNEAPV
jgi:hypothetical protein